ncbi:MAG: non-hydrolyzing UDP-N-acetylglucosamine 2-epimerase [Planctomycetota bacterium]
MPDARPRSLALVAGARPNFMKIAPLVRALDAHAAAHPDRAIAWKLVHTGQHYDAEMSGNFFDELGIPAPDVNLEAGSGSHAEQTAAILVRFETFLESTPVGLVAVVGDVNSTLACSITAKKLGVPVAHIEAGLRSFDLSMPEEINRLVTDRLADLLFVTERDALENLRREGVPEERVHLVGNVMIDTLLRNLERARAVTRFDDLKAAGPYAALTLHRPSNVDDPETLRRLLGVLGELATELPILFARHPRTAKRMEAFGLEPPAGMTVTGPLPYLEMLSLVADARVVLTDSGGLQEETTALGVPCITLRENTERPVTVTEGANVLAGADPDRIRAAFRAVLDGTGKAGRVPELWDGRAAERIVAALETWFDTTD